MNCLSPSILASDFSKLGSQVELLDRAGAQYVHIDIMDGMIWYQVFLWVSGYEIDPSRLTDRIFDVTSDDSGTGTLYQ